MTGTGTAPHPGQVASTTPSIASANAPTCAALKRSPRKNTPMAAALTGSSTVNTPADYAGTCFSPVIQSQTVTMLAAIE